MNMLAVDDEQLSLLDLEQAINAAVPNGTLFCCLTANKGLAIAREVAFDVAFLDIELCDIDGISLAKQLQAIRPQINIVFVTGHADYACTAFSLHASGYVLKPVAPFSILSELKHLRFPAAGHIPSNLRVQCFGNFEVFGNGKPLNFARKKTKELFAYLVSRRGAESSVGEIAAVLWEDQPYSRSQMSHLRNLVSDLTSVLKSVGSEDVLLKSRGNLCVATDRLDCDYYDYLSGHMEGSGGFVGEFMAQYSWAETIAGQLHPR